MLRTAKASNNVHQNNVKFISPAACDFNVVSFESLQNTVCNFRHLGFTWLYSIFILTTNKMELKCPLCTQLHRGQRISSHILAKHPYEKRDQAI